PRPRLGTGAPRARLRSRLRPTGERSFPSRRRLRALAARQESDVLYPGPAQGRSIGGAEDALRVGPDSGSTVFGTVAQYANLDIKFCYKCGLSKRSRNRSPEGGTSSMLDLRRVDLKHMRDGVADRVGRAAKELGSGAGQAVRELGSGAGNAARELAATADESLNTQIRTQTRAASRRASGRGGPSRRAALAGAAAGAVAVYFFDPQRGHARRTQFVDWSGARIRRGWMALNQLGARTGSNAAAFPQRMVSLRSGPRPADDLTL